MTFFYDQKTPEFCDSRNPDFLCINWPFDTHRQHQNETMRQIRFDTLGSAISTSPSLIWSKREQGWWSIGRAWGSGKICQTFMRLVGWWETSCPSSMKEEDDEKGDFRPISNISVPSTPLVVFLHTFIPLVINLLLSDIHCAHDRSLRDFFRRSYAK